MDSPHYIYIIQSDLDGTFYVGYTGDIEKRLREHNAGKTRYTKTHRPYVLIYQETLLNKAAAKKREIYIKKYGNMKKFLRSRVPPT